jgi:hypothetical protein
VQNKTRNISSPKKRKLNEQISKRLFSAHLVFPETLFQKEFKKDAKFFANTIKLTY